MRRFNLRLELPPLRQRAADIPMLIGCLVGDAAATARVPVPTFSREALTLLAALPWRRNFHELREVLEVLVLAVVGSAVRLEDVLDHVALEPVVWSQASATNLREARLSFERHYIAKVLNRHRGRMDDAARSLGMQRTNLYRKVRQLGIGLAEDQATMNTSSAKIRRRCWPSRLRAARGRPSPAARADYRAARSRAD